MKPIYWIYLAIIAVVTLWSVYDGYGIELWILEAGVCIIGLIILALTFHRFQFTSITYFFIFIEIIVLLIGAHYSYSRVPFFDWIRQLMNGDRNNYDKLGHFMQGLVPAFIARELLIRLKVFNKKGWIPFIVVCICMAISAFYEFIEWWGALLFTQSAEDFLGMQGYIWDTQSDMFCAMIGAITMVAFFSHIQDKQINKLKKQST